MPKLLNPDVRERIKSRFSRLLWDQVRPWAYLDLEPIEVKTFDGRTLRFASMHVTGAREAIWDDYIEPFLRNLIVAEIKLITDEARTKGLNARRAMRLPREELLHGIIRLYWTMADVHRVCWELLDRDRLDTSKQVADMMAFLDSRIENIDR